MKDIDIKSQYKLIMNFFDCAHYIFMDKLKHFEFKAVSNYANAEKIFYNIHDDFQLVDELLARNSIINSATILRQVFENILYLMATSCKDESLKVKLRTSHNDYYEVVKNNKKELFTDLIEADDFKEIYDYLCKIVHPCSMKELISHYEANEAYGIYVINIIKSLMICVEYILINFLNKAAHVNDILADDLFQASCFVHLYNMQSFISKYKDEKGFEEFSDDFFMNDTESEYLFKKSNDMKEMGEFLKENHEEVAFGQNILLIKVAKEIENSEYASIVDTILKR